MRLKRTMPRDIAHASEIVLCRTLVDEHGCWIYQGARDGFGYGAYNSLVVNREAGKRISTAHGVVMWALHGPPSEGQQVRHLCSRGHEGCVRPTHMVYGTVTENRVDCEKVNRGKAKLSPSQVRWIRHLCANGKTHAEAAKQFGMARQSVNTIISRQTYAWVA